MRLGFTIVLAALLGGTGAGAAPAAGGGPDAAGIEARLARLDESEDLFLALERRLPALGRSVSNLELPDAAGEALFAPAVRAVDLAAGPEAPGTVRSIGAGGARTRWPLAEARRRPRGGLGLWRPFLERAAFFLNAKFKITDVRFLDAGGSRFETKMRFQGLAVMPGGGYASVAAEVDVRWTGQPVKPPAKADWRIDEWRTRWFEVTERGERLFAEVLDGAITSPPDLERARTSLHERLVERYLRDLGTTLPHPDFSPISADRHPGIAVVDVDGDGRDDLYVMARWGPNLLLRNRGDGTFEETAARRGLDVADHSSSALFADFDNDGDPDLFLGRTLARSLYLVNEGGRFVDRSADLVDQPLPYLVSSVSAADFDRDGLLDIYVSTYAAGAYLADYLQDPPARERQLARFLPEAQIRALDEMSAAADLHRTKNLLGPPNVLLRNAGGGRFETLPPRAPLAGWRNTFQSTWADFDADGDPDLYLANDFAPNNLLRNDGGGRFTDVTGATGTADLGFGMGAAWGDYDNDGWQDLYVTNMYSNAGRRITSALGAAGAPLVAMARGNTLFRNLAGTRFSRVSGPAPPALTVERAGWGWGGQFIDVDNDGYLDIYALSGYYSAPARYALPADI